MPTLTDQCLFDPKGHWDNKISCDSYSLAANPRWRFLIQSEKTIDYSNINLSRQKDFLYSLGFNLTSNRIQGSKYIAENNDFLSVEWVRHNQYDVERGYIHNFTDTGKEYYIPININSVLKKHYLTSQASRRKYHPLTILNGTKTLRTDEYIARSSQKIKHVHGFSMHPSSSVICFDIDAHPEDDTVQSYYNAKKEALLTFKSLLIELNYHEPIFTEISALGGMHVYYKFDKPVNYEEVSIWAKHFNKKYSVSLEIGHNNKVFQLPDSAYYWPIKFSNLDNKSLQFNYYNSTDSYQDDVLSYDTPVSYDKFLGIFIHSHRNKLSVPSLYNNNYDKKFNVSAKDFSYGAGYRVDTIFRNGLGFYALKKSNSNYSDFKNTLLSYDSGSKDFSSFNAESIISSIYSWVKDHYSESNHSKTKPFSIIENDKYLTSSNFKKIESISSYINNIFFSYKYNKCSNDNIVTLNHLLCFIFSRILFEKKTNFRRTISRDSRLTLLKRIEYQQGYIFYTQIRQFIKDTNNILLDIRKVWNTLMYSLESLGLFREYKHHCSISGYEIQKRWLLLQDHDMDTILNILLGKLLITNRAISSFNLKEKTYIIDKNFGEKEPCYKSDIGQKNDPVGKGRPPN